MPECHYCGKEVVFPFKCNYCGKTFCAEHRLPEKHQCTNLPKEPFWYQREKAVIIEAKQQRIKEGELHFIKEKSPGTQPKESKSRKPLVLVTSFKAWSIIFLVTLGIVLAFEYNDANFYHHVSDYVRYLLFAFSSVMAIWNIYKIFRKFERYQPKTDLQIWILRILSGLVLIAAFIVLVIGYLFIFTSTVIVQSVSFSMMGIFLVTFAFLLIPLSSYLLFKFKRKAGIIIFRE